MFLLCCACLFLVRGCKRGPRARNQAHVGATVCHTSAEARGRVCSCCVARVCPCFDFQEGASAFYAYHKSSGTMVAELWLRNYGCSMGSSLYMVGYGDWHKPERHATSPGSSSVGVFARSFDHSPDHRPPITTPIWVGWSTLTSAISFLAQSTV